MELYKCKQQIMAQCKFKYDCDGTYSGTECQCNKDNDAFMPDTADKAKIKLLQAKYEQLQQKHTQAMELLGLAVEDMCSDDIQDCKTCIYHSSHNPNCPQNLDVCIWKWKHADKLEELRGGKVDEYIEKL